MRTIDAESASLGRDEVLRLRGCEGDQNVVVERLSAKAEDGHEGFIYTPKLLVG